MVSPNKRGSTMNYQNNDEPGTSYDSTTKNSKRNNKRPKLTEEMKAINREKNKIRRRKLAQQKKTEEHYNKHLMQNVLLQSVINSHSLKKKSNPSSIHLFKKYEKAMQEVYENNKPDDIMDALCTAGAYKTHLYLNHFSTKPLKGFKHYLKKTPLNAGVNIHLLEHITKVTKYIVDDAKVCSLMFDEIQLEPQIDYDPNFDYIQGFQDLGKGQRVPKFADHACVFMLRGAFYQWRKPIAFVYTQGPISPMNLASSIKEIILCILKTDLRIVSTICKHTMRNIKTISILTKGSEESKAETGKTNSANIFNVDGHSVIALYDVPYMLKDLRNNFVDKYIRYYEVGRGVRDAKWIHIIQAYELNHVYKYDFKNMPNITDEHVYPGCLNKTKLSYATQIFSFSLVGTMRKLFFGQKMEAEILNTSDFLNFVNHLFDSMNGYMIRDKAYADQFKRGVSMITVHWAFWKQFLRQLKSIQFVDPITNDVSVLPLVPCWVQSLEGVMSLCRQILSDYKYPFVFLRYFNLDTLRKFFTHIKSLLKGNNFSAIDFTNTFKSSLLFNATSTHSIESNYAGNLNECMDHLRSFMSSTTESETSHYVPHYEYPEKLTHCLNKFKSHLNVKHILDHLVWKCYKKFKTCSHCKTDIVSIHSRKLSDGKSRSSIQPSTKITKCFGFVIKLCKINLPNICYKYKVLEKLRTIIKNKLKPSIINCKKHRRSLYTVIIDHITREFLENWCQDVNWILSGDKKFNSNTVDPVCLKAQIYFNKKRIKVDFKQNQSY